MCVCKRLVLNTSLKSLIMNLNNNTTPQPLACYITASEHWIKV